MRAWECEQGFPREHLHPTCWCSLVLAGAAASWVPSFVKVTLGPEKPKTVVKFLWGVPKAPPMAVIKAAPEEPSPESPGAVWPMWAW